LILRLAEFELQTPPEISFVGRFRVEGWNGSTSQREVPLADPGRNQSALPTDDHLEQGRLARCSTHNTDDRAVGGTRAGEIQG